MADFCRQCALDLLGHDFHDLAFLGSLHGEYVKLQPGHGWAVICEGCGWILVDEAGNCISDDCFEEHGKRKLLTRGNA